MRVIMVGERYEFTKSNMLDRSNSFVHLYFYINMCEIVLVLGMFIEWDESPNSYT